MNDLPLPVLAPDGGESSASRDDLVAPFGLGPRPARQRPLEVSLPGAAHEIAEVKIEVGLASDADAAELDEATVRLRSELLELDVDDVERPAADEPPAGARAAEIVALGALIVTLARNAPTIASVIRGLQSWLARDRNRSVTLELDGDRLEVTGISSREQESLIAAWIARHAAPVR